MQQTYYQSPVDSLRKILSSNKSELISTAAVSLFVIFFIVASIHCLFGKNKITKLAKDGDTNNIKDLLISIAKLFKVSSSSIAVYGCSYALYYICSIMFFYMPRYFLDWKSTHSNSVFISRYMMSKVEANMFNAAWSCLQKILFSSPLFIWLTFAIFLLVMLILAYYSVGADNGKILFIPICAISFVTLGFLKNIFNLRKAGISLSFFKSYHSLANPIYSVIILGTLVSCYWIFKKFSIFMPKNQ